MKVLLDTDDENNRLVSVEGNGFAVVAAFDVGEVDPEQAQEVVETVALETEHTLRLEGGER